MAIPAIRPSLPQWFTDMRLQEPRRAGPTIPGAAPPEPTLSERLFPPRTTDNW